MSYIYTYKNKATGLQLDYAASLLRKAGFNLQVNVPAVMVDLGFAYEDELNDSVQEWLEDKTKPEISKLIDWLKTPGAVAVETEDFSDDDFDFLDC